MNARMTAGALALAGLLQASAECRAAMSDGDYQFYRSVGARYDSKANTPDDARNIFALGYEYFKVGDFATAKSLFDEGESVCTFANGNIIPNGFAKFCDPVIDEMAYYFSFKINMALIFQSNPDWTMLTLEAEILNGKSTGLPSLAAINRPDYWADFVTECKEMVGVWNSLPPPQYLLVSLPTQVCPQQPGAPAVQQQGQPSAGAPHAPAQTGGHGAPVPVRKQ